MREYKRFIMLMMLTIISIAVFAQQPAKMLSATNDGNASGMTVQKIINVFVVQMASPQSIYEVMYPAELKKNGQVQATTTNIVANGKTLTITFDTFSSFTGAGVYELNLPDAMFLNDPYVMPSGKAKFTWSIEESSGENADKADPSIVKVTNNGIESGGTTECMALDFILECNNAKFTKCDPDYKPTVSINGWTPDWNLECTFDGKFITVHMPMADAYFTLETAGIWTLTIPEGCFLTADESFANEKVVYSWTLKKSVTYTEPVVQSVYNAGVAPGKITSPIGNVFTVTFDQDVKVYSGYGIQFLKDGYLLGNNPEVNIQNNVATLTFASDLDLTEEATYSLRIVTAAFANAHDEMLYAKPCQFDWIYGDYRYSEVRNGGALGYLCDTEVVIDRPQFPNDFYVALSQNSVAKNPFHATLTKDGSVIASEAVITKIDDRSYSVSFTDFPHTTNMMESDNGMVPVVTYRLTEPGVYSLNISEGEFTADGTASPAFSGKWKVEDVIYPWSLISTLVKVPVTNGEKMSEPGATIKTLSNVFNVQFNTSNGSMPTLGTAKPVLLYKESIESAIENVLDVEAEISFKGSFAEISMGESEFFIGGYYTLFIPQNTFVRTYKPDGSNVEVEGPNSQSSFSWNVLGDTTNGISMQKVENAGSAVNMIGQSVNAGYKGVVIMNGKKYVMNH